MRAGEHVFIYIYSQQRFLIKELDKHDARKTSAHYRLSVQKGLFGCCAVDKSLLARGYVHSYTLIRFRK